ncbi:MAG: hypothetical protein COY40_06735 [Alphaproteobacteria bacterium CG_4_10_14_0_8_um_filter_53_9]|nr:MAG: hypothetical protein COY40_06735 [Alphaproteobacteria bacterium CG_4_10_14_0_8_um_filter_53_9]
MDGRDGIRRNDAKYDFLCKGGTWATVSLMLDEANDWRDGVGQVRLLFREWPAAVHPGGGEAFVAQQYLAYVIEHFVPADLAPGVLEGFWKNRDRVWRGPGVKLTFTTEDFGNHVVRKLEIVGLGKTLNDVPALSAQPRMAVPEHKEKTMVLEHDRGLGGFASGVNAAVGTVGGGLIKSVKTLWGGETEAYVSPAEARGPGVREERPAAPEVLTFDAAPAPESVETVTPVPPVDEALVPTAEERALMRGVAEGASTEYKKAEDLTRDFEIKALDDPTANPKIYAASAVSGTAAAESGLLMAPAPEDAHGPDLSPVPTPTQGPAAVTPTDAGLMKTEPVATAPVKDPRFEPERDMPQLRYIPKAKPVNPDAVISFEDEKSAL